MPIECCICAEELLKTGSRLSCTPCGHVYHRQCIFQWLENNENKGSCPICRANFEIINVIPLLTLEESTSSASIHQPQSNKFKDLEEKFKDTQNLLESVMNSLATATAELSAKNALIENLKKRFDHQKSQGFINKPISFENVIPAFTIQGNHLTENCGYEEGSQNQATYGNKQHTDNIVMSELLNSLDDDELELNLSIL